MAAPKKNTAPAKGEVLSESERAELALRSTFGEMTEVSPEAVTQRMTSRLRKATSLDELFDALEGSSSDQWVNKPIEIVSVEWETYQAERGVIPKAVCQVVDITTGEVEEFITTATMLVHFLRQVELLDLFPFKTRIVEKTTRSNQKALNFERL